MIFNNPCRVCSSDYVLFVQDVFGQRTQKFHKQYFCMDCKSFFHTSNYVESEEQLKSDFEYLLNTKDASYSNQNQLVLELITLVPGINTICEIGHGAGFFLKACQDYNLKAVGYDINPYCHDYAKNYLNVDSRCCYFDGGDEKYDLIVANQVFEHLENPHQLFETLVRSLNPDGAIYIAVPKIDRDKWRFLKTAGNNDNKLSSDVFMDNDVHITLFSTEGLRSMGRKFGCRSMHSFKSADRYYKSPGCYEGILYFF